MKRSNGETETRRRSYDTSRIYRFVVMGGGQNGAASGAQDLVNLLTAKTARELGLDLSVSKK